MLFGKEILKIVPGRVSTEVDARYVIIGNLSISDIFQCSEVNILIFEILLNNLVPNTDNFHVIKTAVVKNVNKIGISIKPLS